MFLVQHSMENTSIYFCLTHDWSVYVYLVYNANAINIYQIVFFNCLKQSIECGESTRTSYASAEMAEMKRIHLACMPLSKPFEDIS